MSRTIPNPNSILLANAIVGGVGLGAPPRSSPPEGMATVVLHVPIKLVAGKTPIEIQQDLGLPWQAEGNTSVWLADL